jgi:ABC-2 type transport system permease protein
VTEAASLALDAAATEVSPSNSLTSLLRADMTAQLRSYMSLVLNFALPNILLVAVSLGKNSTAKVQKLGGPYFIVELALTVGLVSIGSIAYSMSIAQDRDRGVLQRLRVTPAPTWTIMASRWIVQLAAVVVMSVEVLVVAGLLENVTLSAGRYVLTVLVAMLGITVFLSIGQAIAGLIPSADTLSAAGRLVYVPLILLSLFGQSDIFGTTFEMVSRWSPGGCLETLLASAMGATAWSGQAWEALFASFAYTVVFAVVGIRWFRWTAQ